MVNEKKKLIDADALWLKSFDCEEPGDFRREIEIAHRVDAVEVVRCGDCRHYGEGHCLRDLGGGSYEPFPMKADDFCSYGERR